MGLSHYLCVRETQGSPPTPRKVNKPIKISFLKLECYRYIELNPVRANMVEAPSEYKWSSDSTNAHGVRSNLLTPHPIYLSLGNSENERLRAYRLFFKGQVDSTLIDTIRLSTQKRLVIGNDIFKSQLEELHGRRVDNLTLGRPSSK